MARRFRESLAETGPFVCRCLNNFPMPRFHTPAYRTGQAELPHPALGKDSRCYVRRRLQLLNTQPRVARLIVNPHVPRCFLRPSLTEVPSLRRHYPASSVIRTSPPPHTARPGSRELPVDPNLRSPLGLPVLRLIHSVCMPSPLPRQDRWNGFAQYCSVDFGLPQITVGSAPALHFSRPAQRSLALQPADSPSRLMRPSIPEAPTALLPPPPLRLLPGGAIQFPGGFISRCGPVPFTAHCNRDVTTAT